jgi:hypothetical protein
MEILGVERFGPDEKAVEGTIKRADVKLAGHP